MAEILFSTHQVSVVGVMRVLVELVRWDCGSKRPTEWKMRVSGVEETLFRHFLKHGGGINVKGG